MSVFRTRSKWKFVFNLFVRHLKKKSHSWHLNQVHHITHKFLSLNKFERQADSAGFVDIKQQFKNHNCLSKRSILAVKNNDVDDFNAKIQNFLLGRFFPFNLVNTDIDQDDVFNYPTELLNSLELNGLPPHNMLLNLSPVIIILRNINQSRLCN